MSITWILSPWKSDEQKHAWNHQLQVIDQLFKQAEVDLHFSTARLRELLKEMSKVGWMLALGVPAPFQLAASSLFSLRCFPFPVTIFSSWYWRCFFGRHWKWTNGWQLEGHNMTQQGLMGQAGDLKACHHNPMRPCVLKLGTPQWITANMEHQLRNSSFMCFQKMTIPTRWAPPS